MIPLLYQLSYTAADTIIATGPACCQTFESISVRRTSRRQRFANDKKEGPHFWRPLWQMESTARVRPATC